MRRAIKAAVLLVGMTLLSGCGTAANLLYIGLPTDDKLNVYGGVMVDAKVIRGSATDTLRPKGVQGFAASARDAVLMTLDLPFSAVADTLTLPVTVPAAIQRRNRRADQADAGNPAAFPLNETGSSPEGARSGR
jgi:uncharacterized protein YceK